MNNNYRMMLGVLITSLGLSSWVEASTLESESKIELSDSNLHLQWEKNKDGWHLSKLKHKASGKSFPVRGRAGEYTLLYSPTKPKRDVEPSQRAADVQLPANPPHSTERHWRESVIPAALNTEGRALNFYPQNMTNKGKQVVEFSRQLEVADVQSRWQLASDKPGDVLVSITITAKQDGYYSIATPTLTEMLPSDLAWATVPGVFAGNRIESNFINSFAYGQGLPARPVLAGERTASALASMATDQQGLTLAAIAEPGTATDPWQLDRHSRPEWRLGLSHMNRRGQISPTLYHPVLGEIESEMKAGESRSFNFRYSLESGDWYSMFNHIAYDVYQLKHFLKLKQNSLSLSQRLQDLYRYVLDEKSSLWRLEKFESREIGAQAYYGDVVGTRGKDAMKNSDYGAMWMLAKQTQNPVLLEQRLPYARDFKLAQQQQAPGFYQGAARGQYFLSNSRKFAEEWGDYVEPVGSSYYVLSDLGNIALFDSEDKQVRERIRLGADKILDWQKNDGSWEVAYDLETQQPLFEDIKDYRPTFYGLIIAYRILGDEKYLTAATKGADWLLRESVGPLQFLGVCGDARFAPDFATAQIAQAMLDLYEITGQKRFLDAGIKTVRFYASSIYTHPIASEKQKFNGDKALFDWQLNQTGLGFEHGGSIGSANEHGPILLASHAGLFIRAYQMTGDELLRDLARAGALARTEAFVDPKTGVATYYYNRMNNGPGQFPHHAWWQIGWITDYLVSEASMRSAGKIQFPRGFFTPKVGPHAAYGFAPGQVFGREVSLSWGEAGVSSPAVNSLIATNLEQSTLQLILLNSDLNELTVTVAPDVRQLTGQRAGNWKSASLIDQKGQRQALPRDRAKWQITLEGNGLSVLELQY